MKVEIPLLKLYLSGFIYRFSDRDIEIIEEDGNNYYYGGYICKNPRIRQSVDFERGSSENSSFDIEIANINRFQDFSNKNLDNAPVYFIKYNLDDENITYYINGVVKNYSWEQDNLKLGIELKSKDIFIDVPENDVRVNSFSEVVSGTADTWDKNWYTRYWLTDSILTVYADNYWQNARIRIKTINPAFKNNVEYVEQRVTQFTQATGKIQWAAWKYISYWAVGRVNVITGKEVPDKKRKYTAKRHVFREGYVGAAELNASTSYVVEKKYIPENSDVLGSFYPIVYGRVEKMPLLWVAADYQHAEDDYLLAGHSIFDTTSTDILLYYDLDEKDPPNEDEDVIGAAGIPNPIMASHSGSIDSTYSSAIFYDDSLLDGHAVDSDDYLNNYSHYEDNYFGYNTGAGKFYGTIEVFGSDGQIYTRYCSGFDYSAGLVTLTEDLPAQAQVGCRYKMYFCPYELFSDTTDNFGNKIAYVSLRGYNGNPSGSFSAPRLRWNLRRGLGKSKVYATFSGQNDDRFGTYTGVPDSLINNPVDVIKHFLLNYTLLRNSINLLDVGSFNVARKCREGWAFNIGITDQDSGENILESFCKQAVFIYFWKNGKIKGRAIDLQSPFAKFKFVENVNIYEGIKVERSRFNDVRNNLLIKYGYSWVKDDYSYVFKVNKDNNNLCKISSGRHGVSEIEEIELNAISDFNTMWLFVDYYLKLFSDIYYIVSMDIPKSYYDIELGDLFLLTHSIGVSSGGQENGWVNKKFIVTGVEDNFTHFSIEGRTFYEY